VVPSRRAHPIDKSNLELDGSQFSAFDNQVASERARHARDLVTVQKKKALEEAYELDPAFPLIHLALASVEADPERAAFLRDFDLKRLPDSCNYTTDLDPAEITLEAAEMCAEQKDCVPGFSCARQIRKSWKTEFS